MPTFYSSDFPCIFFKLVSECLFTECCALVTWRDAEHHSRAQDKAHLAGEIKFADRLSFFSSLGSP